MFVVNEDNSIYATRGDIVFFSVSAEDNGVAYKFQAGDLVRIKVYGKKAAENVVLQKDFPVTEDTEKVEIFLSEEDTKIGEVISKPSDYWYEVELNPLTNPQTIIGYDEDGAKVFKLFPEGDDIPPVVVPTPRVAAVMDDELDMTSILPVQNQAIARAVVRLESEIQDSRKALEARDNTLHARMNDVAESVAMEQQRLDIIISGSTIEDGAEIADARVGADGITYKSAGTAVRSQFSKVNSQVEDNKTSLDLVVRVSPNVLDLDSLQRDSSWDFTPNQDIDYTSANANYAITPVMDCLPGDRFTFARTAGEINNTFRMSSDTLWAGHDLASDNCVTNADGTITVTIPAGVSKCRYCFTTNYDNWENTFMLVKNAAYPGVFIGCGVRESIAGTETAEIRAEVEELKLGKMDTFFFPTNLYLIANRAGMRRIPLGNFVNSTNENNYYLTENEYSIYTIGNTDCVSIDDSQATAHGSYLTVRNSVNGNEHYKKSQFNRFVVETAKNPTTAKNVLLIGDSFMDNNHLPCEVKNILVNDLGLTNVNFVGNKNSKTGTLSCKHCGNAGYTIADYIKTDNAEGRGVTNPFNYGGVISFKDYMAAHAGGGNLDVCVIECGVNDLIVYGYDTVAEAVAKMKTLVDNIHAEYPECKVFVVGQKYASNLQTTLSAYKYNSKIMQMNEGYQSLCESAEYSSFANYVDIGALFDKVYFAPHSIVPFYKGCEQPKIIINDWLHPNEAGYYAIAENIAAAIAHKCFPIDG